MGLKSVVAVCAVLVRMLEPGAAAAQVSASSSASVSVDARLRTLLRLADEAFAAGNVERSKDLLLEAWRMRPTYDVAMNIGQVQLKLGNYAEGANFVAFALRNYPPYSDDAGLETLRNALASVKSKVTTVRISVQPADAVVLVDGHRVGEPPFGPEVFVEPGAHIVEAKHNGQKATYGIQAVAGEERELPLKVPAAPARSAEAPATASSIAEHDYTRPAKASPVVLALGGAITIVGLGAGIGFQLRARSLREVLDAKHAEPPSENYACQNSVELGGHCSQLEELRDDVRRAKDFSTASFALGGAALVATAIYWLWPRKSVNVAVAPSVSTAGLGVSAFSSF